MRDKPSVELVGFLANNRVINQVQYKTIVKQYESSDSDIITILSENSIVSDQTIILLLIEAIKNGIISLSDIYSEFSSVDYSEFIRDLSKSLDVEYIDLYDLDIDYSISSRVGYARLKKLNVFPYREDELNIYYAVKDIFDLNIQDSINKFSRNKIVKVALADPNQIQKHLNNLEKNESVKGLVEQIKYSSSDIDEGSEEDSAILKLIELILKTSILSGGSDIHIEPTEGSCVVRTRIDGMLKEIFVFEKNIYPPLSSRIKLLANLDIAEKRKPQDGRFSSVVMEKNYDFRISTLPIMTGESIVLRILDKSKIMIKLEDLGMHPTNYKKFRESMNSPYGIIFVTGPTGSGKTTTLYAGLNAIKDEKTKIITVEDPVEYQMNLIQQVHVNTKSDLTFANALRSILRQDPDVIMIGEVRDRETLKIAIEAALTGHLVFSTLHTNDAASAISRVVDMGIEPFLVSGALVAIQAQRLIRKICMHCRVETTLPDEVLNGIEKYLPRDGEYQFYKANGCEKCMDSGYLGREMVSEVLIVDDTIQSMIAREESKETILEYALQNGFVNMFEDALSRALQGRTTIDEAYRVAKA
jgi:general secretion pathway protein E